MTTFCFFARIHSTIKHIIFPNQLKIVITSMCEMWFHSFKKNQPLYSCFWSHVMGQYTYVITHHNFHWNNTLMKYNHGMHLSFDYACILHYKKITKKCNIRLRFFFNIFNFIYKPLNLTWLYMSYNMIMEWEVSFNNVKVIVEHEV